LPAGRWAFLAAAVLIVGALASFLGAHVSARAESDRSRRSFETDGEQVASLLKLDLRREEDLINSGRALIMNRPGMTTVEVERWVELAHVFDRHPALQTLVFLARVPRDQLAAFSARATTGVPGPSTPAEVAPSGERPFYCLIQAGVARPSSGIPLPPTTDFCVGQRATQASIESGIASYVPLQLGDLTLFVAQTPIYRADASVETVGERHAAFLGWLGTAIDIQYLFDEALADHPHLTVAMDFENAGTHSSFASRPKAQRGDSYTVDFENGWTATVYRPAPGGGVLASGVAIAGLVGGVAFSALLAALILVQAAGRARAEQLSLHDSLTGLANRVLLADRANQLVLRSRRYHTQGAALYLDLDGFKEVNDTLGHDAGDRLLIAVADRLTTAVREADTIARVGGDEFVVLIDGSTSGTTPELVAARLLDALRPPFDLGDGITVHIGASVGMATNDQGSGLDLIHDADVSMYAAKAQGRDGFVLLRPET
jgi:diguanylate cyclase (GGDEF)-like protein